MPNDDLIKNLFEYISHTPENVNPNILREMLNEIKEEEEGHEVK